ncbi:MAG: ribosome-binding factor A [Coxiella sp. RIFCSPHIGHO2_12_FULL_44_14]|nr:MAG: ribosome-binding factor A [Coxiella sp. RIFCSPHIGHO2_12_FULL_44_14]
MKKRKWRESSDPGRATKRARQVADLIHHQLSYLLKKATGDPRLEKMLITAVELSSDLSQAKIFFTLEDSKSLPEVMVSLEKASGYLRHLLADAVALRQIPQLQFIYDFSIERGERLSQLIDQAVDSDKKLHQKTNE